MRRYRNIPLGVTALALRGMSDLLYRWHEAIVKKMGIMVCEL